MKLGVATDTWTEVIEWTYRRASDGEHYGIFAASDHGESTETTAHEDCEECNELLKIASGES